MIDEAFGHWLAGFIDGEGCFRLTQQPGAHGPLLAAVLTIKVRDDDLGIIEEIHERTGIGTLCRYRARGTSKPGVAWNVSSWDDTFVLAQILKQFPLRAKKRRDARIWCNAVRFAHAFPSKHSSKGRQGGLSDFDQAYNKWRAEQLLRLRKEIQSARAYS
jgi:hypothetical protein